MQGLAVVFALAVIVESIVNLLLEDVSNAKAKKYCALALGIAMTIIWRVGVLSAFSFPLPSVLTIYADYVITGILVSRGSNYLHKWVSDWGTNQTTPTTPET